MSKHIAFVNIPSLGHVNPTLAVVTELVRRGHRVSYVVTEERAACVRAAGAAIVRYRSVLHADADPNLPDPGRRDYVAVLVASFLDEAEAMLPESEPWLVADPPDVIVHDSMAYAGRLMGLKYGIPTVQLLPMFAANDHWSLGRNFTGFDPEHPLFVAYLARLNALLAEHGIAMTAAEFRSIGAQRYLAFYPRAFQYRAETFDDRYAFVGPCVGARPDEPAWSPPPNGQPVALATLGTVYNNKPDFYRACFDAFGDSRWHVVLAVGERIDPTTLGPAPSNVEVHPVVAQLTVLARAQAFVSHGGMGGVMEAVLAGVPQVAVPQTAEQDANAQRLEELGLGLRLPPEDLTPLALRAAVERVVADTGLVERIDRMQAEIVAAGGVARAAEAIEDLIAAHAGRS